MKAWMWLLLGTIIIALIMSVAITGPGDALTRTRRAADAAWATAEARLR
jgi:hypothetical protein